jgi:hypothetical protein
MDQREQLEAFIRRAGFTYGWENLESWARRMAEQAVKELNAAPADPRTTGWVAPKDHYTTPVLFNPYTGQPRDVRDVQSDPQGILIVPPGAAIVAARPAAPLPECPHASEPRGCYRVRCQLGRRCVV